MLKEWRESMNDLLCEYKGDEVKGVKRRRTENVGIVKDLGFIFE